MTKQTKAAETRAHQDVLTRRRGGFKFWAAAAMVAVGLSSAEALHSGAPQAERQQAFDALVKTKQEIPVGANLRGLNIKADSIAIDGADLTGARISQLTNSSAENVLAQNIRAGGAIVNGSNFDSATISGDIFNLRASKANFNNALFYKADADGLQAQEASFNGAFFALSQFTNIALNGSEIDGAYGVNSTINGDVRGAKVAMIGKDLSFGGNADGAQLSFQAKNPEADLTVSLTSAQNVNLANKTTGEAALRGFGLDEPELTVDQTAKLEQPAVQDVVKAAAPHLPPRPSRVLNKAYALAAPGMAA